MDGNCSLVAYLYADRPFQWATGDALGGEGGLGGTPIPGSQTPAIVDIELT